MDFLKRKKRAKIHKGKTVPHESLSEKKKKKKTLYKVTEEEQGPTFICIENTGREKNNMVYICNQTFESSL